MSVILLSHNATQNTANFTKRGTSNMFGMFYYITQSCLFFSTLRILPPAQIQYCNHATTLLRFSPSIPPVETFIARIHPATSKESNQPYFLCIQFEVESSTLVDFSTKNCHFVKKDSHISVILINLILIISSQ